MTNRSRTRLAVAGGLILATLVGARVALPYVVLDVLNKQLGAMPAYTGHIDDVDIALLRGAYVIRGLTIDKREGTSPVPFVTIEAIDLSVQWNQLFHGAIVGEVAIFRPRITFTNGPAPADDQAGEGVDWRNQLIEMFPLKINRLAIAEGEVHFQDFSAEPDVDVNIRELQVEARNLTNSQDLAGSLVATVTATGKPVGYGDFAMNASIDPYAEKPTFDLDMQLKDVDLKSLNPLLSHYAKFDAESGKLELYTEIAAVDGAITGYVKPVLIDAKVFNLKAEVRDGEGPPRIGWEWVVGGVKGLLENDKKGAIATKVPIDGRIDGVQTDTWGAVFSLLGNAYIEALQRAIDYDVSLEANG